MSFPRSESLFIFVPSIDYSFLARITFQFCDLSPLRCQSCVLSKRVFNFPFFGDELMAVCPALVKPCRICPVYV